jgi:hypothetical protein
LQIIAWLFGVIMPSIIVERTRESEIPQSEFVIGCASDEEVRSIASALIALVGESNVCAFPNLEREVRVWQQADAPRHVSCRVYLCQKYKGVPYHSITIREG